MIFFSRGALNDKREITTINIYRRCGQYKNETENSIIKEIKKL